MELDACLKGRRSVRSYKDEPVPKELIESVLEAGVWAPTGMNRQAWRFVVIEDKKIIKMISDETKKLMRSNMPDAKQFESSEDIICYNAPVLIFVCAQADKQWDSVDLLDSVLAAQNMFLKAYELGLGTCYMGFVSFLNSKPDVLQKAGVPAGHVLHVPYIMGWPKNKQGSSKRNKPNILKWVR